MKHSHRVLENGNCETCGKRIDARNPGESGMFRWVDEWFTWMADDDPMWVGYTKVLDQWDRVISVAISPTLAVEGAMEELSDNREMVNQELAKILS